MFYALRPPLPLTTCMCCCAGAPAFPARMPFLICSARRGAAMSRRDCAMSRVVAKGGCVVTNFANEFFATRASGLLAHTHSRRPRCRIFDGRPNNHRHRHGNVFHQWVRGDREESRRRHAPSTIVILSIHTTEIWVPRITIINAETVVQ